MKDGDKVGVRVGVDEGKFVGFNEGAIVGFIEGIIVGLWLGMKVGKAVGICDGNIVGETVGKEALGCFEGLVVGMVVVGYFVGLLEEGNTLGDEDMKGKVEGELVSGADVG